MINRLLLKISEGRNASFMQLSKLKNNTREEKQAFLLPVQKFENALGNIVKICYVIRSVNPLFMEIGKIESKSDKSDHVSCRSRIGK